MSMYPDDEQSIYMSYIAALTELPNVVLAWYDPAADSYVSDTLYHSLADIAAAAETNQLLENDATSIKQSINAIAHGFLTNSRVRGEAGTMSVVLRILDCQAWWKDWVTENTELQPVLALLCLTLLSDNSTHQCLERATRIVNTWVAMKQTPEPRPTLQQPLFKRAWFGLRHVLKPVAKPPLLTVAEAVQKLYGPLVADLYANEFEQGPAAFAPVLLETQLPFVWQLNENSTEFGVPDTVLPGNLLD